MFVCATCNHIFGNKGALTNHLKWKHRWDGASEQGTNYMYMCPECDNAFKSKGGQNVHRRKNHPDVYHVELTLAVELTAICIFG